MHKEEVISELVNLKLQIAQLRLQEKALYEKLELTSTHPKETLKILEPVMRVKRAYTKQTSKRGPQTYYARKKISDNMKKLWADRRAHV
jgi:hypothetical protein